MRKLTDAERAERAIKLRAYQAEWRKTDKAKATRRKWREKNKHRISRQVLAYAKNHKEQCKQSAAKWRIKNYKRFRDNLKSYTVKNRKRLTVYRRNHRKAKPELYRKSRTAWEEKNKGRINHYCSVRRAKTKRSVCESPDLIKKFYVAAKKRKWNTCYYCRQKFSEPPDIDHIVPLSKGGRHAIDNLCVSCEFCNASKKDKLVNEWERDGQQVLSI